MHNIYKIQYIYKIQIKQTVFFFKNHWRYQIHFCFKLNSSILFIFSKFIANLFEMKVEKEIRFFNKNKKKTDIILLFI